MNNYINLNQLSLTAQSLLKKINEQADLKVDKDEVNAIATTGDKIATIGDVDIYNDVTDGKISSIVSDLIPVKDVYNRKNYSLLNEFGYAVLSYEYFNMISTDTTGTITVYSSLANNMWGLIYVIGSTGSRLNNKTNYVIKPDQTQITITEVIHLDRQGNVTSNNFYNGHFYSFNVYSTSKITYRDLGTIQEVPTNVSSFVNDAGYISSYTETDPTVPSWAKAASKPAYTASEVGALASSGDTTYSGADNVLCMQGPAGSNSPILRFQRGTLTDNYNDWQIQDRGGYLYFDERGSGSSTWTNRVMFNTTGGVVATSFSGSGANLTGIVKSVNGNTGAVTINVPTKTSDLTNDSGFLTSYAEETITTSGAVTKALDTRTLYHFTGALTSLTITLNAPSSGEIAHYHFDFLSGSTAPTLTMPNSVTMPDSFSVEASKRYEVDVLNNFGMVAEWTN